MYSLLQPLFSQRECLHGHQTRGVGYLGVSAGERTMYGLFSQP